MRRITFFSPYLTKLLKYKPIWEQIKTVLDQQHELYDFVPNAKDIWVRDFMPFQRYDGDFVVFRYEPDYLDGREKYKTNCRDAFIAAGGAPVLSSHICNHTNLVLDGGNMVKCVDKNGEHCVIMTSKVLYENSNLSHHEILLELENVVEAEVIIVPWDKCEEYGHSDGMVRTLGEGKLLLNCYSDFDNELGRILRKALGNRFDIFELKYGDKYRDNSWCHLNYLELTKGVILVPVANIASDKLALEQIEEYTKKKCIPIQMSKIISEGGGLHCISWTLHTEVIFRNNLYFCNPLFGPQCL